MWFVLALAFAASQLHAAPAKAPDNVLILGDSLSSAHRMADEAGWIALLQKRLAADTTTPPTIHNSSRGGKTLADGIRELPALLELQHPDVVVIELGGNDAILGVPATELQRDLTHLVDLAQNAGAKVTILGFALPPMFDKNGSAEMLRGVYARVAKAEDVTLLPSLLAGISDMPALLQDDGVHPTAAAQPMVLDNAWGTLRPLLLGSPAADKAIGSPINN
jgi:acyl-CoA thioesterase-1